MHTYGAEISDATMCVETTEEARLLVNETLGEKVAKQHKSIATAVTMIMAAGVKKTSIKSALRLSQEMKAE